MGAFDRSGIVLLPLLAHEVPRLLVVLFRSFGFVVLLLQKSRGLGCSLRCTNIHLVLVVEKGSDGDDRGEDGDQNLNLNSFQHVSS